MKCKYNFGFILVYFMLFQYSCIHTKYIQSDLPLNYKYINFDKVKITYQNNSGLYSIKGYIRMKIDSVICFQFWGPLGYEVVKGKFTHNTFTVKTQNNLDFSKEGIEKKLGVIINNKIVQNFLFGAKENFIKELTQKNPMILISENKLKNNNTTIQLDHPAIKKQILINYKQRNNSIKSICTTVKPETIKISIQIFEISYINKINNFRI